MAPAAGHETTAAASDTFANMRGNTLPQDWLGRLVMLLSLLCLAGCATPQLDQLRRQPPPDLPPRVELTNVPFYPQRDYQCGPAALATVLNQQGIAIDPDALADQVYLPGRKGAFQAEMLGAVRRQGLLAYPITPSMEALLHEVAAGNPVLVLQNVGFRLMPTWHYAVVIGYDLPAEQVILRSGVTERLTLSLDTFLHSWAGSGQWAMLAMPPDRLPVSVTEAGYVTAAVGLERVNPRPAQQAYRTALERWPDNLTARLGLGNSAYALHDLSGAEAAFRAATDAHPDAADAWNNLAQTLLDQGRRGEAQAAAQQAVELGGPRLPLYQQTLAATQQVQP